MTKFNFRKLDSVGGVQPETGIDIPPKKIIDVTEVLTSNQVNWTPWEEAQLRELGFWRWVAFNGYESQRPKDFIKHQKKFMLKSFSKTNWDQREFKRGVIVEIGCGPLGMLEFLNAKTRIGIDPLNRYYSMLFGKLRSKRTIYIETLGEFPEDIRADLAICFNVIDHTDNPEFHVSELFRLLRPQGKFIIEVNCHKEGFEGTAEHAKMHPSPLNSEEVQALVQQFGKIHGSELATEPTADQEFPYLIWGEKSN